jgi:hypothetical protein
MMLQECKVYLAFIHTCFCGTSIGMQGLSPVVEDVRIQLALAEVGEYLCAGSTTGVGQVVLGGELMRGG